MPTPLTCQAPRRREQTSSNDEVSCAPTAEQSEAAKQEEAHKAEREAEARRNAYYESGTDVGGRSQSAASDPSPLYGQCDDDPRLRASQRTARLDPPIQSDPLGNALIGAIGGGIVNGVRAAAGEVLTGQTGKSVIEHVAIHVGKNVVKEAGKEAAKHEVKRVAAEIEAHRGRHTQDTSSSSAHTATTTPPEHGWAAGMSSPQAASVSAPERTQSGSAEGRTSPVGRDRVPYAPGKAPLRVPEAPRAVTDAAGPIRIRG